MSTIEYYKRYERLDIELDDYLDQILFYGKKIKDGKKELFAWYSVDEGLVTYKNIPSVLTELQMETVSMLISAFKGSKIMDGYYIGQKN
jgi:hypothetical protein